MWKKLVTKVRATPKAVTTGGLLTVGFGVATATTFANEDSLPAPVHPWSHGGWFSAYDHASIRRGHIVYTQVCASCHSMDLLCYRNLVDVCYSEDEVKAMAAEQDVVDWIFEDGELDFLPKEVINEFLKNRFNNSLESIGIDKVFEVDQNLVSETEWFDDEIIGTKHGDFFVKRSINYSKRSQSITNDDLF